jgi:5'-3' exoribonuclease 1
MYSDCCAPGEGEHKIMDFLRYAKGNELFNKNTTHCVYSPDADVILLTLAMNLDYICIIKEDTSQLPSMAWTATSTFRKFGPPQFELVMINILREYFEREYAEVLQQVKSCTVQKIINDLVLLMAFVGNDFLPNEFCFVLKDSHLDALFKQYREYLLEHEEYINN